MTNNQQLLVFIKNTNSRLNLYYRSLSLRKTIFEQMKKGGIIILCGHHEPQQTNCHPKCNFFLQPPSILNSTDAQLCLKLFSFLLLHTFMPSPLSAVKLTSKWESSKSHLTETRKCKKIESSASFTLPPRPIYVSAFFQYVQTHAITLLLWITRFR